MYSFIIIYLYHNFIQIKILILLRLNSILLVLLLFCVPYLFIFGLNLF